LSKYDKLPKSGHALCNADVSLEKIFKYLDFDILFPLNIKLKSSLRTLGFFKPNPEETYTLATSSALLI
jgi:hypothetical protein